MMRTGLPPSGKKSFFGIPGIGWQERQTVPETQSLKQPERRKHRRMHYVWPVRFRELNGKPSTLLHTAKSKNLSRGGMKITSIVPLERNAITLLDVNWKSLAVMVPTDHLLMIPDGRILAEVAWRCLNLESRLFEAGLRFIEKKKRRDYEALIARASAI